MPRITGNIEVDRKSARARARVDGNGADWRTRITSTNGDAFGARTLTGQHARLLIGWRPLERVQS